MNFKQIKRKYFSSTEEIISMFLGLVIVVVVGGLIFNYFQKNKGIVNIPGSTDEVVFNGNTLEKLGNGDYEVVKGDNLWKVATEKYGNGYAWVEISKANNLNNPSSLEVGQKLMMPQKVVVGGKEFDLIIKNSVIADNSLITPGTEYTVVKGDSLWEISVKAYGDGYQWTKIWQENKLKLNNANSLEIGMGLMIPKLN